MVTGFSLGNVRNLLLYPGAAPHSHTYVYQGEKFFGTPVLVHSNTILHKTTKQVHFVPRNQSPFTTLRTVEESA